MKDKYLKY
jgi:hypothetical protein